MSQIVKALKEIASLSDCVIPFVQSVTLGLIVTAAGIGFVLFGDIRENQDKRKLRSAVGIAARKNIPGTLFVKVAGLFWKK